MILLIDKPKGITSFGVIRVLRRQLGIRKMGHAGTLDPLATGLLIIGTEKSTKELASFMGLPKEYEFVVEFGKTSTSYDADGEITEGQLREVSREEFEAALQPFVGEIQQRPPIFSAIKVNGRRAYDRARKGEEVVLEPRTVTISSLEVLEWNWPFVKMRMACSKGTYVRSLAHDLGQVLGVGGYVTELRRTAIGSYRVEDAELLELPPRDVPEHNSQTAV